MKLGVFFLGTLVALQALTSQKTYQQHVWANYHYDHIYQFDKPTSLNACDTWSKDNISVPVHNLFCFNKRNTTCLDVNWDMKTKKARANIDVSDRKMLQRDETSVTGFTEADHERETDHTVLVYNSGNYPTKTMIIEVNSDTEDDAAKRFLAKIDTVDATGKITAVSIVNEGKMYSQDSLVKVRWWGDKATEKGHATDAVTLGEDAEFEVTFGVIGPDKKGKITGITIKEGGKNYQATENTFSPKTWVYEANTQKPSANKKIEAECTWTDKLGAPVTFSKLMFPDKDEDACKFGASEEQCKCTYFAVELYDFPTTSTNCQTHQMYFENRFNGKFTMYAYTWHRDTSVDQRELPEGLVKETHGPLGESVTYNLEPKWKYDDRNLRKKLTLNVSLQEDGNRWNCDKELMDIDDAFAKYSCDQAKTDRQLNPVEWLNKRAKAVKHTPFVTGLVTQGALSINKDDLPDHQFEKDASNVNLDGSGCEITRSSSDKGVLKEIRVLYGGEGCTEAPMLRLKQAGASKWMNVTLTVKDGAVTAATYTGTDVREHAGGNCNDDTKNGDETGVDEGGSCANIETFRAGTSALVYELWDFSTLTGLKIKFPGANADDSKDSEGQYTAPVEAKITYDDGAIISDHADILSNLDTKRNVELSVKDAGKWWQKIADLHNPSKIIQITQKTARDDVDSRAGPAFEVIPQTTRNCKIPPQFEFVIEDGGNHEAKDAKCKFVWEEIPCPDGVTQNYTLKDIIITEQGTGYKYFTSTDSDGVVSTWPRIQLPSTKQTDNWFNEKITVKVGDEARAEIAFTNTDGVITNEVKEKGKGYRYIDDVTYAKNMEYGMKILMPTMSDHHTLDHEQRFNGQDMVRDLAVLEGGSGYKDFQRVCCFKAETGGADAIIYSHLPNGYPIGSLTLDEKGSVTGATLDPSAHSYCLSKSAPLYAVCGAKLKSISFSDEEYECGKHGLYAEAPQLLFDKTKVICDANNPCDRPIIKAVLKDDEVDSFTVEDGGWFNEATAKMKSKIAGVLYRWGGELKEACAADGDTTENCNKSPHLDDTLNYIMEWEETGKGALLMIDYGLETLNAIRGKGDTNNKLGGAYQVRETKIQFTDDEGIEALDLARSAFHTFDKEKFPIGIKAYKRWDATATAKTNYYVETSGMNADGTLKDFLIRPPYNDKAEHTSLKTKYTEDLKADGKTAVHVDNKIAEHAPYGIASTIYDKEGVPLNGYDTNGNTAENSRGHQRYMFGKVVSFGALDGFLSIADSAQYDTYDGTAGEKTNMEQMLYNTERLISIDENFTQTWTYEEVQVFSLKVKVDMPVNVGSFYYPSTPKISPRADKIPFETEANLFKVFTSFHVSFEVEDMDFIGDVVNVTVYKSTAGMEDGVVTRTGNSGTGHFTRNRFRVCPKHNLYESIHFTTEVIEGTGSVRLEYCSAHNFKIATKYEPFRQYDSGDSKSTYYPNNWFKKYEYTNGGENQGDISEQGLSTKRNSGCVDVTVVYDDNCEVNPDKVETWDDTLKVRLTAKVNYFGGECIIDDDCVDRTRGGGATKASFAVRESANSDIDRFTFCYVAGDQHAPTCRECHTDTECDGGQFCHDSTKIIENLERGHYFTKEMQAWAHKMINKHGTCQKKEGLGKRCGHTLKTKTDGGVTKETSYPGNYHTNYIKNGDTHWCGGKLYDYDGQNIAAQWEGFCESHVCTECTTHPYDDKDMLKWEDSGKKCVAGQLVNARLTGITTKNDYWEQAQKLSTENEEATAVAQTKLSMLTDIMGVTLMFGIFTAFSTMLTTLLLMGRCNGCKTSGGGTKVSPE